jgi:hypothetical protein
VGLYGSGPLIKNKLFAFVALEQTRTDGQAVAAAAEGTALARGWAPARARWTA